MPGRDGTGWESVQDRVPYLLSPYSIRDSYKGGSCCNHPNTGVSTTVPVGTQNPLFSTVECYATFCNECTYVIYEGWHVLRLHMSIRRVTVYNATNGEVGQGRLFVSSAQHAVLAFNRAMLPSWR